MKKLTKVSEDHVRQICKLVNEPFVDYMVNDGYWDEMGLEIQIRTDVVNTRTDSYIWIYKDGKILLYRNDGTFGGSRYEPINTLPIIDFLRKEGFEFGY